MTFAFGAFTLGAALLYSAFKDMSVIDLVMGRPGQSIASQGEHHPGKEGTTESTDGTIKGTSFETSLGNVPKNVSIKLSKGAGQIARMAGKFPYSWGGGHGANPCQAGGEGENGGPGYDCSGCWSCVLFSMGAIKGAMTSGQMATSFDKGPGKYVTLYANDVHVFGKFLGTWFGTGHAREAKRGGPAIGNHDDLAGYTICHPRGW